MIDVNEYMTQKQAAARLGISEMSLSRWIRQYGIPTQKLGARYTLVRITDIREALQRAGKLPVKDGGKVA